MPPSDHALLLHDNSARRDGDRRRSATAAAAGVRPRARSATELQQNVLALVRSTRSRVLATDQLTAHYESLRVACVAWLDGNIVVQATHSNSAAPQHAQNPFNHGRDVSKLLRELAQYVGNERRALVAAVVHSIHTTAHVMRVKRRKRRLPATIALAATAAHASNNDNTAAGGALRRVAELLCAWLLHSAGLLRLEDVLLGVAASTATNDNDSDAWTWLTAPVHTLLAQPAQRLLLPATDASSATTATTTTHAIVECVLLYLIRLAFPDASDSSPSSSAAERAATDALDALCAFTSASFSVPALQCVTQLLTARTAATLDTSSRRRYGPMAIACDRVAEFLQPQLARLVAPASSAHTRFRPDELQRILQAYEACLRASARVQIVRQSVYEATHGHESEPLDTVLTDATGQDAASVIAGALYELVTSAGASRPTASAHDDGDFASHVLTLAHELASDGVQSMRGALLRHALELVAAVARGSSYRDWVYDHFSALDESDTMRQRADSASGASASASLSSSSCRKPRTTCRLITSKRQIQFLCAFLLEFDRRDTSARDDGARRPVALSEHVAAHLSVMKTHQAQFPTGGLIMDFCSQTRSRYLELLQREQAASAATASDRKGPSDSTDTAATASIHSLKVRAMVREHIALHRETHKLSPQLRQWKLFQAKLWKHELVPCCLDLAFDDHDTSSAIDSERSGDAQLLAHVAFVHALAKSGLVTVSEYAQFLTHAETHAETRLSARQQQTRLETQQRHKRQRSDRASGDALERALERLQLEQQRNDSTSRRLTLSESALRSLQDALGAMLFDANTVETNGTSLSETTAPWTQRMWSDGCVRVLDALGLDRIDAFFAAVVPALSRSDASGSNYRTSESIEASVAAVGLQQIAKGRSSGVDAPFVRDVSCFAALTASLVGKLSVAGDSPRARSDVVGLVNEVDAACIGAAIDRDDSARRTHETATKSHASQRHETVLSHDQVLRRSLFFTLTLRALGALPLEARNVTLLLKSEALEAPTRAFIAWLGYRSVAPHAFTSDEGAVETDDAPLTMLSASMQALAHSEWFRDVFDLASITTHQLERIVSLELRYARALFSNERDGGGDNRQSSRSISAWLSLELDVMSDFGAFRIASVESVVEWIVSEILTQVTTAGTSSSSLQAPSRSDCKDATLRSTDDTIALLLLLLNDVMHRLSADSQAAAARTTTATLSQLDRVLMFFVDAVASRLEPSRQSPHGDERVFPANRALQHHGFEAFEVIVRHHERHASSQRLVDLLGVIGAHFYGEFPPSLLHAVTHAIACVLRTSSANTVAKLIRDLPLAVVARCGLAFPRLRATLVARSHSLNGAERQLQAFIAHLAWLHSFANSVVSHDQSSSSSGASDRKMAANGTLEPLVSPVFASRMEHLEYALALVKLFVRWRVLAVPDAVDQPHVERERVFADSADRILRVCRDPLSGDRNAPLMPLPELAGVLMRKWRAAAATATDAHFQLVLIHAVALLCTRSAAVATALLRSWQPASSLASSAVDSTALFLVLVAIVLRGADGEQLRSAVRLSNSVWLNEFPRIALHVHSATSARTTIATEPSSHELVTLTSVVASTQRFRDALVRVLRDILELSVAHHVDVLDAALPRRISEAWPSLRRIAAQFHVLVPLDESSEF